MTQLTRRRTRRPTPAFFRVRVGAPRRRLGIVLVGVVVVALVVAARCVWVQGLDLDGNATAAMAPQMVPLPATRGTITDRDGVVLAESEPAVNITADPTIVATNGLVAETMSDADELKALAGPAIIAGILSYYLGGYQDYYDKLTVTHTEEGQEIKYVKLASTVLTWVNLQITEQVSRLGYTGLFREQAPMRNYPNGSLAANVLGFMTYSDELEAQELYPWTGGDGLEYALNDTLAGQDGQEIYQSSPYGRIPTGLSVVNQPSEGVSYQTTIDAGLQYMQDQSLAAAVQAHGGRAGSAITVDPTTGHILALSTYPTFDPNDPGSADSANLGNRAVREAYEPGSVEKVITMAALVDQGLAAPDTRVIVPGRIASGDSMIGDAWGHDTIQLTGAGVIAQSSNIGMVVLTRQSDKAALVSYLHSFGLGAPTGLGLATEATGHVPDATMSDQTRDNIAFGQGLSVSVVQEAAAIAAIANHGTYISPTLLLGATNADGTAASLPPQETHQVISPESAEAVLAMMEQTPQANPRTFTLDGYRTAGKSGTAEAVDPACGCYSGTVVSYVGVAPAENPALVTYVVIDHPSDGASGSLAAAPVVHDVMAVALARYGVPPSTTATLELPLEW
jgi:cell division protein FtsI (penicillin-binding protein 3)